jgi:ABC-type enterochelin transport system permease subunit
MGKGFNYRKYIWVIPWIFVGMVFISLQVAIYSQDKHRVVLKTPSTVSQIDLSDTMVFYINTDSLDNDSLSY